MPFKKTAAIAAALLSFNATSHAGDSSFEVVAVRYMVNEQSPDRVEEKVTNPLERILFTINRMTEINSTTSHGVVDVEIQFEGGATERDLAEVRQRIESLTLDRDIEVTTRAVRLTSQRLSQALLR